MSEDVRDPSTSPGGTAPDGFLAQMIRDVGDTISREIGQLRADVSDRATGGAKGAGLLAGAGAAGAVTLAALASLPLMALRRVLPGWLIALILAGGAGALTAKLTRRGLSELGAAAPVDVQRIKDAVRGAVRSSG